MQIIKEISTHIEQELNDAEDYIKEALKYKETDRESAKMYYDLSMDEMRHADKLHNDGARLITEYKSMGNEAPPSMQAVYDYLHERHINHASQIKVMQAQFVG